MNSYIRNPYQAMQRQVKVLDKDIENIKKH